MRMIRTRSLRCSRTMRGSTTSARTTAAAKRSAAGPKTFRQYQMLQTPRAAREEGGATVVTTEVSGTFPGSPIELDFRFVLKGERIRELRIG